MYIYFYIIILGLLSIQFSFGQIFPFQNPNLSTEYRVSDLVKRMTLEEKVSQMVHDAPAIPRLGIPAYNWWNECLHGVARAGTATVFPQSIGLAATWNDSLVLEVADVISTEARAKHHEFVRNGSRGIYQGLTMWSPNINIFRDPRWGRGQETYGEDPYLTSKLGVSFIKGLQGNDTKYFKVIATPKHFAVHSGPESKRHSFNSIVDNRDLYETYLPHFEAAIKEGGAYSIMGAYNRVNGEAACAHTELLGEILRKKWGFKGFVVSDCGAIEDIFYHHKLVKSKEEAAALAVKKGCELSCFSECYSTLANAVKKGLISENTIDTAVTRLFSARFKLGFFDPESFVNYAHIPYSVNDSPKHQKIAIEAAKQSLVLLKNENNILPLGNKIKRLVVVGPNANDPEVLLGNYNGTPSKIVTPLEGIQELAEKKGVAISYFEGCAIALGMEKMQTIPAKNLIQNSTTKGLKAEYFKNMRLSGTPALVRTDTVINFLLNSEPPAKGFTLDSFSVRWTGKLLVEETGKYIIGVTSDDGARLWIDGKEIVNAWTDHSTQTDTKEIELIAGKEYDLKLEYYENGGDAVIKLVWRTPEQQRENSLQEMAYTASKADAIIAFLGISPNLEGEEMGVNVQGFSGGDRTDIELPTTQKELLTVLKLTGKPVIIVLLNGSAIAVDSSGKYSQAILEAWYPGQAGGIAIAQALFGEYNPGGKLPITFYHSLSDLPTFEDYRMAGRTYRFYKGKPQFPFGHGLSYTQFSYTNLNIAKECYIGQNIKISVEVKNVGAMEGDEVVQLYLSHPSSNPRMPIRSLQGFKRIHLMPGESKIVSFELTPKQYAYFDDLGVLRANSGDVNFSIGGKQPGFTGLADATTTEVLSGTFKLMGSSLEIK